MKPKHFLFELSIFIISVVIVQFAVSLFKLDIQNEVVRNISNMIIALGGVLIALIFSTDLSRIIHKRLFDRITADKNKILIKISLYFLITILMQIIDIPDSLVLSINFMILAFIVLNAYHFLSLKTDLEKKLQQEKRELQKEERILNLKKNHGVN